VAATVLLALLPPVVGWLPDQGLWLSLPPPFAWTVGWVLVSCAGLAAVHVFSEER
jgi:hypothetical protein